MANNKFSLKHKIYNKPISIILLHGTTKEEIKRCGESALIPIYGMPLLVYQVNLLRNIFPQGDFIIISGENIGELEKVIENVRLAENSAETGSAYAVLVGLRLAIDNPVLVIHGNNFFTEQLFDGLSSGKSTLIYNDAPPEVGIIINESNDAEHLFYSTGKNWCEIMLLYENEVKLYKKLAINASGELNFELINKVIDGGGSFTTKKAAGGFRPIKAYSDIKYLRTLI